MGLPPSAAAPTVAPVGAPPITVTQVGGSTIEVLTLEEKRFYETTRDRYQKENSFTAVTDEQDLDRLLILELMVHRWQNHMARGQDYSGHMVDEVDLRRAMKDYSTQITAVKASMGLAKVEREKDANDSVGAYIVRLKQAAKQFGIHREKQAAKAIALMMEAKSLAGTYKRSNDAERQLLGLSAEDIVDWIHTVAGPEMEQIDADFRKNHQRYWAL
ncbi:MAG: hypothetical protein ACXVYY_01375 [Oryzihumus sp.]